MAASNSASQPLEYWQQQIVTDAKTAQHTLSSRQWNELGRMIHGIGDLSFNTIHALCSNADDSWQMIASRLKPAITKSLAWHLRWLQREMAESHSDKQRQRIEFKKMVEARDVLQAFFDYLGEVYLKYGQIPPATEVIESASVKNYVLSIFEQFKNNYVAFAHAMRDYVKMLQSEETPRHVCHHS